MGRREKGRKEKNMKEKEQTMKRRRKETVEKGKEGGIERFNATN